MPDPETTSQDPEGARDKTPPEDDELSMGLSSDQTLQSGEPEGGELPDEYKPYSQFPWDNVPEDARADFLQALKKFHGDMSRGATEAAELRKLVPELKQKAEFLDQITANPSFLEWYQRTFVQGQTAEPPQGPDSAPTEKLSELLDPEATKALSELVRREIQKAVGPIAQQVDWVGRLTTSERVERDIDRLRSVAKEKGWPSVDEHLTEMTNLISQRRAANVEDAYWLCAKDKILDAAVKGALKNQRTQLEKKAETTVPPGAGPSGLELDFPGSKNTLEALRAARRELMDKGILKGQ